MIDMGQLDRLTRCPMIRSPHEILFRISEFGVFLDDFVQSIRAAHEQRQGENGITPEASRRCESVALQGTLKAWAAVAGAVFSW